MPTLAEKVAAVVAAQQVLDQAVETLQNRDILDPTDQVLAEGEAVALLGPALVYTRFHDQVLTFRLAYIQGDPADLAALAQLKAKLDQAT